MAICMDGRKQLTAIVDHAELLGDVGLIAGMARLSNDLAEIERLARDARQGRYTSTAR